MVAEERFEGLVSNADRIDDANTIGADILEHSIVPNSNGNRSAKSTIPTSDAAPQPPYSVFSRRKKQMVILAASIGAVFSTLTAQTYLPALKVLADDFNVSVTKINLTVTTYLVFQGVTPLLIGTTADRLGRRPAYIVCFAVYLAANIGLALAPTYASLLGIRCLQAAGISGTQTLCQAVVADTITSAERGQYIGFVTLSAILGPSLGPLIGGALASNLGWRSIFWFLAICAGVLLLLVTLFFPETCRPLVGDGSIPPPKTNMTVLQLLETARRNGIADVEMASRFSTSDHAPGSNSVTAPARHFLLASLTVLLDKETIMLLAYGGLVYGGINAISASLPSLFSSLYGYDSLHIGSMYLPMAGGSVVAVSIVGKAINWNYRRHAERLGLAVDNSRQMDFSEFPIEQARLEVLLPPLYLTAVVIIAWGWCLQAHTSVAAPIVLSFVLGVAYIGVLNVSNTLVTDLYRKRAGTAVAANWFVRCMFAAAATALINPLVAAIGPGWAFTIIGVSYVLFSPAIILIMWKGLAWRQARQGKTD
nr:itaconate transport protein [Quercus suber]